MLSVVQAVSQGRRRYCEYLVQGRHRAPGLRQLMCLHKHIKNSAGLDVDQNAFLPPQQPSSHFQKISDI